MLSNQEIAKILYEISEYLEMQDIPFKPRAYQRAARAVEAKEKSLAEIYQEKGLEGLEEIPGIGKGIAQKIEELIKTGKLKYFEKLKKQAPVDVSTLSSIEGMGPKKIKILYKKLGIRNLKDLERAAKQGKIKELEGFGEKSEENILRGIEFLKKGAGRLLLGKVLPLAEDLKKRFASLKEVQEVEIAGSLRRRKETVGDIDMLVVSDSPQKVMEFFVSQPEVENVYSRGETRSSVRLSLGIDMDLRVVPADSFGSALQYFTGNKDHNIALRRLALAKRWKLNEYGLFSKGEKRKIGGRTEKEIYQKLGLCWIPPEIRQNKGELEAAQKGKLPDLIPYDSLRGDLQIQTSWSDGAVPIQEMAQAAQQAGLEYILITDHTKTLSVAHGLDEKRLLEQGKEIDRLNQKFARQGSNFRILKGAEVNILKDGSLDIEDDTLKKLDVVLAAIHSHFNLSPQEQTNRLLRAIRHPYVDIIAHPTGRIIGKREGYILDMEQIFKAAKETGTALEIDAYYDRLDLSDVYVREAIRQGIKLTIDSDAHHPAHLNYLNLGVAVARRGWAQKKDILNTLPLESFLKNLPKRKNKDAT